MCVHIAKSGGAQDVSFVGKADRKGCDEMMKCIWLEGFFEANANLHSLMFHTSKSSVWVVKRFVASQGNFRIFQVKLS
jgi:hypothetical protein